MATLTLNKVPNHLLLKRKADLEQRKREEGVKQVFKSKKTKVTSKLNSDNKKENENTSVDFKEERRQSKENNPSRGLDKEIKESSASKKVSDNQKPISFKKNERVQKAIIWLYESYPNVFHKTEKKPLKIGILQDIFAMLTETSPSKTAIRDALTFYTGNSGYQKAVLEQPLRYDLNGVEVSEIEEKHKTYATKRHKTLMELMQKQAEKKKAWRTKHKKWKKHQEEKIAEKSDEKLEENKIEA